jgi:HSP20 family protein
MKASNVNVTLENDGHVLAIAGERAESGEHYSYSSKFYQSFTLDPAIETEKITANLKDGMLVVAAPKDLKRIEASVHNIPITEKEHDVEETKEEEIKVERK